VLPELNPRPLRARIRPFPRHRLRGGAYLWPDPVWFAEFTRVAECVPAFIASRSRPVLLRDVLAHATYTAPRVPPGLSKRASRFGDPKREWLDRNRPYFVAATLQKLWLARRFIRRVVRYRTAHDFAGAVASRALAGAGYTSIFEPHGCPEPFTPPTHQLTPEWQRWEFIDPAATPAVQPYAHRAAIDLEIAEWDGGAIPRRDYKPYKVPHDIDFE
jgi:hypothetical protein